MRSLLETSGEGRTVMRGHGYHMARQFQFALLVTVFFFWSYAGTASGAWITTAVDSGSDFGRFNAIATDSSGRAHMSYYNLSSRDLRYATNASGSWVKETVDSTGDVGSFTSIAIDSSDRVHVSYYDSSNRALRYATNASGSWVAETVDSEGIVGWYTSIALDVSGRVHISYYDAANGDLRYATNASGPWVAETVDFAGDVGSYTSIATDASGRVHISYYDDTNGHLKYATDATGLWVIRTVDIGGDTGWNTSIGMDSSGRMHISYYDVTNGNLKYATNASGMFVVSTLDSGGDVGLYTSIAVGSSDKVHIGYYDLTNKMLKYTASVIPLPAGQQSFFYNPVVSPVRNIKPSGAKPVGIGSVAMGGGALSIRISLEQMNGPVNIYGAYQVSTDPLKVNVLNPDNASFSLFTIGEIEDALRTGKPPKESEPWKSNTIGLIDQLLFEIPVSLLSSGTYTVYLLVTNIGGLNSYYLWSTSFSVP